jgi:hypothetical protein
MLYETESWHILKQHRLLRKLETSEWALSKPCCIEYKLKLGQYTVGTSFCKQTYSHGGVCAMVHKNLQFTTIKAPPDWREIFAAVATATISPKFHVDCGKEIRVVIHINATVSW